MTLIDITNQPNTETARRLELSEAIIQDQSHRIQVLENHLRAARDMMEQLLPKTTNGINAGTGTNN